MVTVEQNLLRTVYNYVFNIRLTYELKNSSMKWTYFGSCVALNILQRQRKIIVLPNCIAIYLWW